MDSTEEQVIECFLAVFPSLTRDQIRNASPTTVEQWDSIAGITLLTVLEEQFGISVAAADLPGLVSFASILDYIRGRQLSPAR
jgi:acyl carrier protein